MTIPLRTWWDIDHDKGLGLELDPIEAFIHSQEPAGPPEQGFRESLTKMLDYVDEMHGT